MGGPIDLDPGDDDRFRTESQREWADWAAHGYRKLYQPRSILVFGLVFSVALVALILAVLLYATRNLP